MEHTTNIHSVTDAPLKHHAITLTTNDHAVDALTHLHNALLANNAQAVHTTIDKGVHLNSLHKGTCALHKAIFFNTSVDIVHLLLSRNADPNIPSASGITPLALAVLCNVQNVDILEKESRAGEYVDLLIQHNAYDHKHAALEQACYNHIFYPNKVSATIVEKLIACNSEVNKKYVNDYIKKNPLFNDVCTAHLLKQPLSRPMHVDT